MHLHFLSITHASSLHPFYISLEFLSCKMECQFIWRRYFHKDVKGEWWSPSKSSTKTCGKLTRQSPPWWVLDECYRALKGKEVKWAVESQEVTYRKWALTRPWVLRWAEMTSGRTTLCRQSLGPTKKFWNLSGAQKQQYYPILKQRKSHVDATEGCPVVTAWISGCLCEPKLHGALAPVHCLYSHLLRLED